MADHTSLWLVVGSILLTLSFLNWFRVRNRMDVWLCTTAITLSVVILLISIGVGMTKT